MSAASVVIGLSAIVFAMQGEDLAVLTVRPEDARTHTASTLRGLPSGSFDPADHRTFELALRAFVTAQTGFELGYVEQLYTFGDQGRDAPLPDLGAEAIGGERVVSVGYLALTPRAVDTPAPHTRWAPWSQFFPWEDWREGRPSVIDSHLLPALENWAQRTREGGVERAEARLSRARVLFAGDGHRWNEERVLDRYELLYEAGLAAEAGRDRARAAGTDAPEPGGYDAATGRPMVSDHRRILATGLGRLRGKLKYRPVVFELLGPEFTLSALQRTVEAVAGLMLHKQNFRRAVERTALVEGLGQLDADTGGRPAELFRFRRELLAVRPVSGLAVPGIRDA